MLAAMTDEQEAKVESGAIKLRVDQASGMFIARAGNQESTGRSPTGKS